MGLTRIAVAAVAALAVGLVAGSASGGHTTALTFAPVVGGLDSPVYVTTAPGDPTTLYVVEQLGTIKIVRNGAVAGTFLDIRSRVKSGGEQGLLSVAFHPQYATNHRFYVDYTDTRGDTRVVEFRSANGVGKPGTARQLLFVDQPYDNHNGGQLEFDKNGYLYVGMGDGGSGGDPENRAQNLQSRLGKLLRINPTRKGSAWQIVGFGLRNPWRFSFDRSTGAITIGDVGQGAIEEIDHEPREEAAGVNFGWSAFEGRSRYNGGSAPGAVPPVIQHTHAAGWCSIVGGYVMRDASVPALRGRYVYGDLCQPRLYAARLRSPSASDRRLGLTVPDLVSFGEDAAGHVYAVSLNGPVYRIDAR
jgi:glucose/arabinose dehydrogenase